MAESLTGTALAKDLIRRTNIDFCRPGTGTRVAAAATREEWEHIIAVLCRPMRRNGDPWPSELSLLDDGRLADEIEELLNSGYPPTSMATDDWRRIVHALRDSVALRSSPIEERAAGGVQELIGARAQQSVENRAHQAEVEFKVGDRVQHVQAYFGAGFVIEPHREHKHPTDISVQFDRHPRPSVVTKANLRLVIPAPAQRDRFGDVGHAEAEAHVERATSDYLAEVKAIGEERVAVPFPDPEPWMLEDPRFNAIWSVIKTWDVAVPGAYNGYTGAMGNHARLIFDALFADRAGEEEEDIQPEPSKLTPAEEERNEIMAVLDDYRYASEGGTDGGSYTNEDIARRIVDRLPRGPEFERGEKEQMQQVIQAAQAANEDLSRRLDDAEQRATNAAGDLVAASLGRAAALKSLRDVGEALGITSSTPEEEYRRAVIFALRDSIIDAVVRLQDSRKANVAKADHSETSRQSWRSSFGRVADALEVEWEGMGPEETADTMVEEIQRREKRAAHDATASADHLTALAKRLEEETNRRIEAEYTIARDSLIQAETEKRDRVRFAAIARMLTALAHAEEVGIKNNLASGVYDVHQAPELARAAKHLHDATIAIEAVTDHAYEVAYPDGAPKWKAQIREAFGEASDLHDVGEIEPMKPGFVYDESSGLTPERVEAVMSSPFVKTMQKRAAEAGPGGAVPATEEELRVVTQPEWEPEPEERVVDISNVTIRVSGPPGRGVTTTALAILDTLLKAGCDPRWESETDTPHPWLTKRTAGAPKVRLTGKPRIVDRLMKDDPLAGA